MDADLRRLDHRPRVHGRFFRRTAMNILADLKPETWPEMTLVLVLAGGSRSPAGLPAAATSARNAGAETRCHTECTGHEKPLPEIASRAACGKGAPGCAASEQDPRRALPCGCRRVKQSIQHPSQFLRETIIQWHYGKGARFSLHRSMIETIHKKFCELTGVEKLTLSALRMQIWSDFISRGFTEADLELVVMWIKRQIPRGSGFSNLSLQFSTFFKNGVDTFEERLALAKLKRRPIC